MPGSKFADLKAAIASKLATLPGFEARTWEPPAVTGSRTFTMFSSRIAWNEANRTKVYTIIVRLLVEAEGDDRAVQEEIDSLADSVASLIRSDPSLGEYAVTSWVSAFDHSVVAERRLYHVLEWAVEAVVEEVA